jgi:hypothetical protein
VFQKKTDVFPSVQKQVCLQKQKRLAKVLQLEPRPKAGEESPLTPEMKEFIDSVVVPILVKEYLAESQLAEGEESMAKSSRSTAALHAQVRP